MKTQTRAVIATLSVLASGCAVSDRTPFHLQEATVEGVQTALTQGELMGRGRIVAGAMEQVLVGRHRGHLAPGTPRSGLAPHVFALMDELRLPGVPAKGKPAMTEPEDIRLDPLPAREPRGPAGPRSLARALQGQHWSLDP